MTDTYKGSCFCGSIKFELTGAPEVMGYCHCTDCAEWAGAPINAFSLWAPGSVNVTAGAEKLGSFAKTENSHRKFCTDCGGHIMSEHPAIEMTDVYLVLVPELEHKGDMHIYYSERTMSVPDGLPKFKDMPADFGGSGDMVTE